LREGGAGIHCQSKCCLQHSSLAGTHVDACAWQAPLEPLDDLPLADLRVARIKHAYDLLGAVHQLGLADRQAAATQPASLTTPQVTPVSCAGTMLGGQVLWLNDNLLHVLGGVGRAGNAWPPCKATQLRQGGFSCSLVESQIVSQVGTRSARMASHVGLQDRHS
jgi:hypothetical protein